MCIAYQSGDKTAKEIIGDRVQGFDLEAHSTSNKQLSSSKMKELKNKIDSRTATREEYNLYEWNKKMSQHFKKHGTEVGANDVEQYLRKAEEFSRNLRGARKAHVPGATPRVVRYYKNGKYIDMVDGKIISFGKQ